MDFANIFFFYVSHQLILNGNEPAKRNSKNTTDLNFYFYYYYYYRYRRKYLEQFGWTETVPRFIEYSKKVGIKFYSLKQNNINFLYFPKGRH